MSDIIQFGGVTGYVRPSGKQTDGDGTTTWQIQVDRGLGAGFLQMAIQQRGVFNKALGGFVVPSRCSAAAGHFDTVTLVYDQSPDAGGGSSSGDRIRTEYQLRSARYEKPLPEHKNYRFIWDHNLYKWIGEGEELDDTSPPWAQDAVDGSDADGVTYEWAQDLPAARNVPGGWQCVAAMEKPGITSFLYFGVIVEKREFFRSEAGMEGALRKRGMIEAPGKYAHLAEEWLVTDCRPENQKNDFVCYTEYTGADAWDHDLYEVAE